MTHKTEEEPEGIDWLKVRLTIRIWSLFLGVIGLGLFVTWWLFLG